MPLGQGFLGDSLCESPSVSPPPCSDLQPHRVVAPWKFHSHPVGHVVIHKPLGLEVQLQRSISWWISLFTWVLNTKSWRTQTTKQWWVLASQWVKWKQHIWTSRLACNWKKGWHHVVFQLSKWHCDLLVFIFYLSVIEYLWNLWCQHNRTPWQIFISSQKGSNDRNQSCENVLL